MDEDYNGLTSLDKSVGYMVSHDWKKRFIAEYAQLVTRIESLLDVLWASEEDQAVLECPVELLAMQVDAMSEYRRFLEIRADLYKINLSEEVEKLNKII